MMDIHSNLEDLEVGWRLCKGHDDQKHALIEDLFAYISALSLKLSEAEVELRDKKDVIQLNRSRLEEVKTENQALKLEKESSQQSATARHVFASVVIDGDCMPFKDELLRQGLDGGKKTASLLKQAVENDLRSRASPDADVSPNLQVLVRVYANMKGLAKTYKDMDILPDVASLDEFVRGFNMGDALCDFVDAGNGKECSDEKVKATFRVHLADVHCHQILFGGTADNGYARLLGPCVEDETARGRITLIEGPPFANELADLKDRFRVVSFNDVFRTQKLLNLKRRVSFHITPPMTPSTGYASAVAKAAPPSSPGPSSLVRTTTSSTSPKTSTALAKGLGTTILRNKLGQRVDQSTHFSQSEFGNIKARKLCNSHHLLGACSFMDAYGECSHQHGDQLSPRQLQILRAVARQSPCPAGLGCNDPSCILGHRCARDGCALANCRFSVEMHNVDTRFVA
ncbi:hypothetical protein B0T22DRAFT_508925 [Podospora appendiculata]|uniref:CCCH zinc finger DNA binding protein n=1 Tax=Podospora appendiculata TaxID=314037 RepID=A0AAE0XLW1_9PEZI|nr:hypothetical protein B0T22DRAFT_508925 [Podospora appendiculata]